MRTSFNKGVEDFRKGVFNIPDVPFFQLKTQEHREYWQGWIYARGRKKYIEEQMTLNDYAKECHKANINWWKDPKTGEPIQRNFGELIALCHSELSEALEGNRKNLMDDKLPNRRMDEVELADCLIRIFDLAAGLKMDINGAYEEKMIYNANRADHKLENRVLPGGKSY